MLLQLTSGCIASEKVSDDDVNKLLDGEMPDNRESKCYITCVMKQFSLVSFIFTVIGLIESKIESFTFLQIQEEDGKTTLCDSCILNVAKTTGISKDKLDIITEITEACKTVSHEDKSVF